MIAKAKLNIDFLKAIIDPYQSRLAASVLLEKRW